MHKRNHDHVDIRPACREDSSEIHQLITRSIREVSASFYDNDKQVIEVLCSENTPETLARAISDPDSYLVVAVLASGRIVGVGSLHKSGEIRQCYVAPEALRKQVGSRILEALEERALGWDLSELRLNSSLAARRFYATNGFRAAGESFLWKDVVKVYPMRKRLRQDGAPNAAHVD